MKKQKIFVEASKKLEKMSLDMAGSGRCYFIWGEIKLPDCIRQELETERIKKKENFTAMKNYRS